MTGKTDLGALRRRSGSLELFRSLPDSALDAICAAMRVDRVAEGALVFEQGERACRAYAVDTGSLRITQTGSNGRQAIVRFIGPGEMFGTAALFADHSMPADAIAAEESLVLSWSEADLLKLIDLHPAISLNVIAVLSARLGQLQERVRELTTQRADQRIAKAVLRLATQAGCDGPGGTTIILPLRRKDLAEYAGTTLHTASRTLAGWEKAGLLISANGRLTVLDMIALGRIVEATFD